MDPRDFQKVAEELSNNTSPAYLRSAISRSYYAAYHVGGEFLEDIGFVVPQNPEGHKYVENCLWGSEDPEIEKAANILGELLTQRIRADYKLDRPEVERPNLARTKIKEAREMIGLIDRCTSRERRSSIFSAIQKNYSSAKIF